MHCSTVIEVPLTQGKAALVSLEDYSRVNKYKWRVQKVRNTWYAITTVRRPDRPGRRKLFMHRLIMCAAPDQQVDHRNGDGLDNRRDNLRFCTASENQHNQHAIWGISRFKGVHWYKQTRKWMAQIQLKGKPIHLGYFSDEIQAARAYDAAASRLFGPFAKVNFPEETTQTP